MTYTVQVGNNQQPVFVPSGYRFLATLEAAKERAENYAAERKDHWAEVLDENGEVVAYYESEKYNELR